MRRTVLGLIGLVAMIPASIRAEAERPGPPSPSAPPAWISETLVIKMDWSRREMWNPDNAWRETLMRDFDPDLIAWTGGAHLNAGRWFTMRGVRVAGAATTGYFTEIDGSNPLLERLGGNGVHEPYGWGSLFDILPVCPVAPLAQGYCPQHLFGYASSVDMLAQDNICFSCAYCECPWCLKRFRSYLRKEYSQADLEAMGIRDIDQFRFSDSAKLQSPAKAELRRARTMCNGYLAMLETYQRVVAEIRRLGRCQGRELPFYGNQGNHFGQAIAPVILTPLLDAVFLEAGGEQPRYEGIRKAWGPLSYKIGAAAGNYEKPIWRLFGGMDANLDAAANGAVMSDPDDSAFPRFANRHRSLLLGRHRRAQVALIWSLPSILANRQEALDCLAAAGTVLENAHIPYEVVIFGHSRLMDDRHYLARLARYDAVILPSVKSVNGDHAKAIDQFLGQGKGIVILGECATCDENGKEIPTSKHVAVHGKGRRNAGGGRVANIDYRTVQEYLKDPFKSVVGDHNFTAIRDDILWALHSDCEVSTTAPETVWLNVWENKARKQIAVHLVNYAASPSTAAVPFRLSLKLPKGFDCNRVRLVTFRNEGPSDLAMARQDRWVHAEVPSVKDYSIVVFTDGSEMEAAEAIAQGRKLLGRLSLASQGEGPSAVQPDSVLCQAEKHYAAADFATALETATRAVDGLREKLGQTILSSTNRERADRISRLARGAKAVRAFDFGNDAVADGFQKVTATTPYEESRGFGWEAPDPDRENGAAKANLPDALHRDWVAGCRDAVFLVDLPNDTYTVTVITGNTMLPSYRHFPKVWCDARTNVYANEDLMLLGIPKRADVFEEHPFHVRITDGRLRLRISRKGNGPWQINGLLVERAVAGTVVSQDELRARAIRDWLVLGPVADRDGMAFYEARLPNNTVDLKASYQGVDGAIQWRRYTSQSQAGFCRVNLDQIFSPTIDVMAYAATRIHAPRPTTARLFFSSTGRAVCWLNGRELLTDLKTDGVTPDEHVVTLNLARGWNCFLVKVCNNWSKEWGLAASLLPMEEGCDLQVRALGDSDGGLPTVVDVQPPVLRCSSPSLESPGTAKLQVVFHNRSRKPCSGALRVGLPPRLIEAVTIHPTEVVFTGLSPNHSVIGDFTVSLVKPIARKTSGPRYTGPNIGGEAKITESLHPEVALDGTKYRGEPLAFQIVQPKLRLWSQATAYYDRFSDAHVDLYTGGTYFGCDVSYTLGIYMGIAKYRGLCTTTTGLLHPIPTALPATRFVTSLSTFGNPKLGNAGVPVPKSVQMSQRGDTATLSFVANRGTWQTETEIRTYGAFPVLFVKMHVRNMASQERVLVAHQEGRHPHWGSREVVAYTVAGSQRVALEDRSASGNAEPRPWSGFDSLQFDPRGKTRHMASRGSVFLHAKDGPGYGILVPEGVCVCCDDSNRPFLATVPEEKSVKPGEAVDISYAIVNAENAAELEAIVQRLSHTEEFVASVCLGNPLSRQIVGDLVVKLPEGYSANLAKEPVVLAPGQWAIRTFSVSGPKRAHSRLPVELILTVPGMGELRETGTVSVLPSAIPSSLRDAFVPR